jgi:hypothetical protein
MRDEFMTSFDVRMLLMQGYGKEDVFNNSNINMLARWTPFACGVFGVLGFWLKSPTAAKARDSKIVDPVGADLPMISDPLIRGNSR